MKVELKEWIVIFLFAFFLILVIGLANAEEILKPEKYRIINDKYLYDECSTIIYNYYFYPVTSADQIHEWWMHSNPAISNNGATWINLMRNAGTVPWPRCEE